MKNLFFQLHLIVPALASLCILAFIFYKRHTIFEGPILKWFSIATLLFFTSYFLILFAVLYIEIQADLHLQSCDLDNNGFMTGEEITPEMEEAMINVRNDTARTFAPFTGLVFSGIITVVLTGLIMIITYLKRIIKI